MALSCDRSGRRKGVAVFFLKKNGSPSLAILTPPTVSDPPSTPRKTDPPGNINVSESGEGGVGWGVPDGSNSPFLPFRGPGEAFARLIDVGVGSMLAIPQRPDSQPSPFLLLEAKAARDLTSEPCVLSIHDMAPPPRDRKLCVWDLYSGWTKYGTFARGRLGRRDGDVFFLAYKHAPFQRWIFFQREKNEMLRLCYGQLDTYRVYR